MALPSLLSTKLKPLELLSGVTHYDLPPIPCSLPVKCHPQFAKFSRIADTWAIDAMQLQNDPCGKLKAVQSRAPLLYCFLVPFGIGEEEMIAGCKYSWSTSFVDDPFDEETDLKRAKEWKKVVLRAANGTPSAEDLMIRTIKAYSEIMMHLQQMMAAPVFSRFMRAHYAWADHCVELVRRRQHKDPPTVATYLADRCENLLVEPIFILAEVCMKLQIDPEFLSLPEFKKIWTTMLEHAAIVNDVLSIRVDILNGHYYTYPGLVFQQHPEIQTFQEAVDYSVGMIQTKERKFIKLHEMLTDKARQCGFKNKSDLLKYVEALPNFIAGNLYWHYLSARYFGVNNPFLTGEPVQGTILIHPRNTVVLPPYQRNKHPFLIDVDNLELGA
ncbi:hypothetical protein SELMODRAFT_410996 [Selaginella moellendorffii]|uniref:Terpene synthase n=1 Tax=Selaginella moellendorffii TaxID=88036 RepID=D8RHN9_SELML|nr:(E)-2-epi-beta-caryophyllene synthase-like [Selaginella moellendorffii]EFJ28316.1 hypothetical protein SELMODRAFT_410996 [Selaginella moellendorffii]|eukprot:XP_002970186.1 (E)-2-epi-beta-caryophyllene synthase-like [Selaginella moellendorffii]